jgi:hypothetical protein
MSVFVLFTEQCVVPLACLQVMHETD